MKLEGATIYLRKTWVVKEGDDIQWCHFLQGPGVEMMIEVPPEVKGLSFETGDGEPSLLDGDIPLYPPPGALIWEG